MKDASNAVAVRLFGDDPRGWESMPAISPTAAQLTALKGARQPGKRRALQHR